MVSGQPLCALLRHGDLLVVDKPAGLPVTPGRRGGPSVEALLARGCPAGRAPRAVHRLDQDTSGCLVLACRPASLRALGGAFACGRAEKLYLAIVAPAPQAASGRIEAPLAKISNPASGWRMVVAHEGAPASTSWQVVARSGGAALVAFRPETGRTHQLRVHAGLLAPGAAIVGDRIYGRAAPGGLMLHAGALSLPWKGGRMVARAPLPARFPGWAREPAEAQIRSFGSSSEAIMADAIRSGSGR